jgi:hypothetical protein
MRCVNPTLTRLAQLTSLRSLARAQDDYSITDSSHLHGSIAFLRVWNDMELQQDDVEQLYDGREIRPPQRQCPTGRYTSDVCVDFCPAGTFADADSAACVKCFPGKANPDSHATASDACVSCAAGETSELGAASCTPCPAGTFSYSNGASRCTECVAGSYSSVGVASCEQVRFEPGPSERKGRLFCLC